ncbi:TonB-dependent receptor [Sphingomonas sabuli]|uniref:TonB-dependent receptor n=1 Tax=Sphingomonas sabuli TaxID=2764186 RepID=UPI001FEA7E83|nr:TonB-dependent receptor [Sphingomonas sabuli]
MVPAAPAFAQDAPVATDGTLPAPDPVPNQGEEENTDATAQPQSDDTASIVVTGYRRSLENAVNKKKSSNTIVESVSAEDIGKLPDASIAESISRLPGLTSQRLSGRSNVISIRGFAPDFSTTLLNGREQTSTGDNRAVEYDQYPSEVINQVNVYKTPMASLIGQGLSGTVDLRTIRPLEASSRVISVGARGSFNDLDRLNPDVDRYGYRVNGVFVDKFAGDTIGVALAASYLDEPYQTQEFNSWGYPEAAPGASVIGGEKSYATSTNLKRLGLLGTLEFRPIPNFTSTLDAFYSNFKDDSIKRGVELPLFWSAAQLQPGYTVTDGLVTNGTYTNVKGVVRNDVFQRRAKLYSFGWNNTYNTDNGWHLSGDVSYSRTKRNELTVETYSGTGRGGLGATDTLTFVSGPDGTVLTPTLDYGDFNTILLTSPQGWGGTQIAPDGTAVVGGQDGYYNDRHINDRLWQLRGDVTKDVFGTFLDTVQAGINFTHRKKNLTPEEYFIGLAANTDGLTSIPVPEQYREGTANLDFLGLGPVVAYDPLAMINDGIYNLVPNPYGDVVVKAYNVTERLLTPYVQANIKTELGTSLLTGNIGVQAIFTEQRSVGASALYLGTNPNGSPNIGATVNDIDASYVDVLPSLNLSLRTASDFVFRFAAAREIIRPRLDDMKATLNYGYNYIVQPDGTGIAYVTGGQGASGNPELRPWRANAIDFTIEKYFGVKGYLAAQFFHKDLKSYIYNQDTEIPIEELVLAPVDPGFTVFPIAVLNIPVNGKGGKLYGVELAGTLPLDTFTPALTGFGVTGGVSYTKSKIKPSPNEEASALPGYSKWVANGTAYYERAGFNIRGSVRHRSKFIGEVSGFGANRARRQAAPETVVDGQIGYDFQPGSSLAGLSLYLQGQNLTNEPFKTYGENDTLHVIDYQTYGRRFLLGASYKFGAPEPALPVVLPPPPPPPAPATQTCTDGTVILATEVCPAPPPPPPPPAPAPERG